MMFTQPQKIHFFMEKYLNLSLLSALFLDIFIVMRRCDKQEITAELKSGRKDFKAMNVSRDHYLSSTIELPLLLREMPLRKPLFIPVFRRAFPPKCSICQQAATLRLRRRVGRARTERSSSQPIIRKECVTPVYSRQCWEMNKH